MSVKFEVFYAASATVCENLCGHKYQPYVKIILVKKKSKTLAPRRCHRRPLLLRLGAADPCTAVAPEVGVVDPHVVVAPEVGGGGSVHRQPDSRLHCLPLSPFPRLGWRIRPLAARSRGWRAMDPRAGRCPLAVAASPLRARANTAYPSVRRRREEKKREREEGEERKGRERERRRVENFEVMRIKRDRRGENISGEGRYFSMRST